VRAESSSGFFDVLMVRLFFLVESLAFVEESAIDREGESVIRLKMDKYG
jgi:hypothetical protein